LWLFNNQISDISPLADLVNLTVLVLDGNQISDLTPLTELVNLERLSLFGNDQTTDWSPVDHVENVMGRPE